MKKACIFNIQRYSLHDGGGIRTIVFFKGCPFHCPWCSNPEGLNSKPELMYKKSLCINCSRNQEGKCLKSSEECPSGAKEIVGKMMSVEAVTNICQRDQVFYETSEGGVTLSGGEFLLQEDFALALLKALKENKINTAIETTMGINLKHQDELIKNVDTFLIDMKIIDEKKAKDIIGIDLRIVKRNIEQLKQNHANIIIRIPLIPTYTTTPKNIQGIIDYMLDIGLDTAHLLPFHKLGEAKYESINKDYTLHELKTLEDGEIEEIKKMFIDNNITVIVGGN